MNLWAVPLLLGLCLTAFQGAVQTHNSLHCPVFRARFLNKVYQVVLTLTYGHPVSAYVPGHNLSHHKHTQSRRDVMRTTKTRYRWNLLNGLFFMSRSARTSCFADCAYFRACTARNPPLVSADAARGRVLWAIGRAARARLEEVPALRASSRTLRAVGHHHDEPPPARRLRREERVQPLAQLRRQARQLVDVQQRLPHDSPPPSPGCTGARLLWPMPSAYAGKIHPSLEQRSLLLFLWRTFAPQPASPLHGRKAGPGPQKGPTSRGCPSPPKPCSTWAPSRSTRNSWSSGALEPRRTNVFTP